MKSLQVLLALLLALLLVLLLQMGRMSPSGRKLKLRALQFPGGKVYIRSPGQVHGSRIQSSATQCEKRDAWRIPEA